jgi:hypothetical protein
MKSSGGHKHGATQLGISLEDYEEGLRKGQRYCKVHDFQDVSKFYVTGNSYACIECTCKRVEDRRLELRIEVLDHYSGGDPRCALCGEDHFEFLALDHINGGGNKHRKKVGNCQLVYQELKRLGFPDGYRVLCHNCNHAHRLIGGGVCKGKAYWKACRLKLKKEIFNHYGNKCACCGEDNLAVLSIDHINGGGRKHIQGLKNKKKVLFYQWLKNEGFPPGFRTLCMNCNMAKGFFGHCPHEYERRRKAA